MKSEGYEFRRVAHAFAHCAKGWVAGGPGSDVSERPTTVGAPSFAQFAKGGNSGR
jgi:hypothetical protein